MKKYFIFLFLIITTIKLFAFPVNSTVVPWAVGLRIRENPITSARVIAFLGLWEKLTVVEVKNETETINGNIGNWVKIKRENSQTYGWCFSYFLEEIKVDEFFPILEYRALAHSHSGTGYGSREVYTQYNNGKRREKLTLNWENKIIDTFDNLYVSDNGRVIAFNWLDTTTIKRNSRDGTISGNKILFVYNFSNHNLIKIDELFITQSDVYSDRWQDKWDMGFGETAKGFYLNRELEWFILNSTGTKLFYGKNNAGIEVNLITGNRVNHQINRESYHIKEYLGNYIILGTGNRTESVIYDPVKKIFLTSLQFYKNDDPNSDGYYYYPLTILKDRYLVIGQNDNKYNGIIIFDLLTNQQRKLNKPDLKYNQNEYDYGAYHSEYFDQDFYYIVTTLSKRISSFVINETIIIRKVDYNNNVIAQSVFNNIPWILNSQGINRANHIFKMTKTGIIQIQEGDGMHQGWMILVFPFNKNLLNFSFFDYNYRGAYYLYLMNKY